jgi:glucose/arabinose dehydrogenase
MYLRTLKFSAARAGISCDVARSVEMRSFRPGRGSTARKYGRYSDTDRFISHLYRPALTAGLAPVFAFEKPAYGVTSLPKGLDQTPFMGGLKSPMTMELAPDGRLFVAEQRGTLRLIQDG